VTTTTRPGPAKDFMRLARDTRTGLEAVTAQFHGHAYDMHRHDEWLVGVTHAGVQDFFCRGSRQVSTTGRVILMEPGERHDGQAGHARGFRYSMLYLPQALVRGDGGDAGIGFRQTLADDQALAAAIAVACAAVIQAESPLAIDEAADQVVALLRGHLGKKADALGPRLRGEDQRIADRAMEYIRAHFDEAFGLDELARAAGAADRFQLARAFGKRYGCTPHACLVEIRLSKARALLRGEHGPAEVAMASGFADQSHLGRWFRRAYGITPAGYRRARTNVPDTGRTGR
jgi:AraC-like DNA-binding protein